MFRLGETRLSAPRFCNSKQRLLVFGRPFAGYSLTFFGIPPIFFCVLHGMASIAVSPLSDTANVPQRAGVPSPRFRCCLAGTWIRVPRCLPRIVFGADDDS